jgi:hypothetical protein
MHRSHLLCALMEKYGYVNALLVSQTPSIIEASELAGLISSSAEAVKMPTDSTQSEGQGSISTVSAVFAFPYFSIVNLNLCSSNNVTQRILLVLGLPHCQTRLWKEVKKATL